MANWKVSREVVELFPHFNADSLEIAKLGERQYVVKKGVYRTGDILISIPEKSILPAELAEDFKDYLRPGDRVGMVKLRGELSEGIVLLDIPELGGLGEDVSEKLGVKMYSPEIPMSMQGTANVCEFNHLDHDCYNFGSFSGEFEEGEEVIVTEKIHGSLISVYFQNGKIEVTSKGLAKRDLMLEYSEGNIYWKAVKNSNLQELVSQTFFAEDKVQIIGEVIPCQKGFDYGLKDPIIKIFRVVVNGKTQPYYSVPENLRQLWVPIVYIGPYSPDKIRNLAKGNTCLGQFHIKEGVVVSPRKPRYSEKLGHELILKIISDAYLKKSDGTEFN